MPGLKFTTDLGADDLYKIAFRRAQETGYTVRDLGDLAFTAKSGSKPLSVVFGALVAVCDFRIDVEKYADGSELVLERNSPWWTGVTGVSRVKTKAQELMTAIKTEVIHLGGHVKRELEF